MTTAITPNHMTLNRDWVLRSVMGQSISFAKGVATYVPKAVQKEAIAIGAVYANGADANVLDANAPKPAPTDPSERAELIGIAVADLTLKNNRDDFAASGSPKLDVVSAAVGFKVDKKELDGVMKAISESAKAGK